MRVTKYITYFNNYKWLYIVAYLADIFNSLNSSNISLKGTEDNIFCVEDNIEAILIKLELWRKRLRQKENWLLSNTFYIFKIIKRNFSLGRTRHNYWTLSSFEIFISKIFSVLNKIKIE